MFGVLGKGDNKKFLRGALFLAAGSFFAKVIGAVYRVPLTNLLQGEGIGLYQMVFPIYTLLLEFSGAAVPSALSALISGYRGDNKKEYAERILKNSVKIFFITGLSGSLFLALFGKPLSVIQGNSSAVFGYLFMAPAVLLTAVLSCYRGYFQGLMNMAPTAISQIIEQTVKAGVGLLLVKLFMPNVALAVGGATLAVSLSEVAALIYTFILFRKRRIGYLFSNDKKIFVSDLKSILKIAVPVSLLGTIMPLSGVSDTFFIVNILNGKGFNGTALYGLLSGAANTIINLPVSLCYAISVVSIPAVSGAAKIDAGIKERNSLILTLIASVLFAIICFFAAPLGVNILFRSLNDVDKQITVRLIRILSGNVVFLSVLQTVNSLHVARKTPYKPLIGLGFGVAVKTILFPILLNVQNNVYGGAICFFACYFSACLINLLLLIKVGEKNAVKKSYDREFAN
ncbi:MAG: polysaccharide biosynthesis protein [Clostridia bacterium]|nr:polysaccharide biosynthesis protein [Clostridia bacterium]